MVGDSLNDTKTGSSPRVRGSRREAGQILLRPGIIPAGAGLTEQKGTYLLSSRDHPRGCGAHFWGYIKSFTVLGSSPRVRGSLPVCRLCALEIGIIPAGAGLTELHGILGRQLRDHPRGCGAHHQTRQTLVLEQGSSPRVRGSLIRWPTTPFSSGIIPAGAGLTAGIPSRRSAGRDHPRGCGAHKASSKHGAP